MNTILAALLAAALAAFVGTSVAAPPPKDGGASGGTVIFYDQELPVDPTGTHVGPIDVSAYKTIRVRLSYDPSLCGNCLTNEQFYVFVDGVFVGQLMNLNRRCNILSEWTETTFGQELEFTISGEWYPPAHLQIYGSQ